MAALAAVPGLNPTPTKTGPIVAGDAWPVWRSTRWANQVPDGVRLADWWVMVALPNVGTDVTTAEADPLVEVIGAALVAIDLHLEVVEPFAIPVESGQQAVPVLRYSVDDGS